MSTSNTISTSYQCEITDATMEPRFHEGEIVFASGSEAPKVGDDVVVSYFCPTLDGPVVAVRRVENINVSQVTLAQIGTGRRRTMRLELVDFIHPVTGRHTAALKGPA